MPDTLKDVLIARHPTKDQTTYSEHINDSLKIPDKFMNPVEVYGDMVKVPTPGDFRSPTPITADKETSSIIEKFLTNNPNLRGIASSISKSATPDSVDVINSSNDMVKANMNGRWFDPYNDFPLTNVRGLTNQKTKAVTLNPNLDKFTNKYQALLDTIAHEYAHVAGYGDKDAYPLGNMFSGIK